MSALEELMLIIKKCLKFLDAFGFSLKNKIMFLVRQSYQITRAIIASNPIKMMNYPTIRKSFVVCFFPNQDMFKDITSTSARCSRVFWFPYQCIFPSFYSTTLPIIASPSFQAFQGARSAYIAPRITEVTTVNTRMSVLQSPLSFLKQFFGWIFYSLSRLTLYTCHNIKYTIESEYLQARILR